MAASSASFSTAVARSVAAARDLDPTAIEPTAAEPMATPVPRVDAELRGLSARPGAPAGAAALRRLVEANNALFAVISRAGALQAQLEAAAKVMGQAPAVDPETALRYAQYISDATHAPPGYDPATPLLNGRYPFPTRDQVLISALRNSLGRPRATAQEAEEAVPEMGRDVPPEDAARSSAAAAGKQEAEKAPQEGEGGVSLASTAGVKEAPKELGREEGGSTAPAESAEVPAGAAVVADAAEGPPAVASAGADLDTTQRKRPREAGAVDERAAAEAPVVPVAGAVAPPAVERQPSVERPGAPPPVRRRMPESPLKKRRKISLGLSDSDDSESDVASDDDADGEEALPLPPGKAEEANTAGSQGPVKAEADEGDRVKMEGGASASAPESEVPSVKAETPPDRIKPESVKEEPRDETR